MLPLGGFSILTWVVFHARIPDGRRPLVPYVEAVLVGLTVPATGGSHSPVLPYLLSPGLALGLLAGPRAIVRGAALATAGLVAGRLASDRLDNAQDFSVAAGQWVLLGLGVGLVAAWARRLVVAEAGPLDRYAEARALLQQLRTVTRGLPTGLDVGAAAETLLEDASRLTASHRSAVLVQPVEGGSLVPVAVRGTKRVPWRTPLTEAGPLRSAWLSREPVVERRKPDRHGRREAGSLAVVPLIGSDAPFGLLIMESREAGCFPDDGLGAVRELARAAALRLETALLFDEVRSVATAEERDRLAREVHDGIAQELAFLGYRLDELRVIAVKTDPDLATRISELRKDITELISNLRLSITDLKTSVSRDRGLGSALSSYVRAIAAGRPLTVHISLKESPFRLPSDREVALFQLAQVVAQDVRHLGRAKNLWVTLTVDPPSARLLVEHDGAVNAQEASAGPDLSEVRASLERLGGTLTIRPRTSGGMSVIGAFEGGDDDGDHRPADR